MLVMEVLAVRFAPGGNTGASPGYGGRGKVAPTRTKYTAGCLMIPARFMCGGGRRTETVAAFRVACVSSLYRVSYDGSPTIESNCLNVKANLRLLADGALIIVD